MVPVLYIEETRDDSTKDWHFCIRYNRNDTYVVYGYRYNYKQDFYSKMTFLSRTSLVNFLKNACCTETSKMDLTMYFVDKNKVSDNFDSYYYSYNFKNELFGYDDTKLEDEKLMDMLAILRDMRM